MSSSQKEINLEEQLLQLQSEKSFLETVVKGLNHAAIVAMTDLDGTIVFVNKKFTEVSGYSAEELIGSNHRILKSGHHPPEFFENMWSTIAQGKTWHGEVCNRRKDGTFYWVDTTILAFTQANGQPGYLAIRFEITARKKLEEQLIYNSKLASLGEMAAGLAHQLNNPLSIIVGYLDVIGEEVRKNPEADLKLKKAFDRIGAALKRLTIIIAGLRIFSRSSSSKFIEKTLVQRFIEDTLTLCQERFLTYQVEVRVNPVPGLIFHCNRADLTQVVLNLLNNSFEAVRDLPEKWIELTVSEQPSGNLKIAIKDSGKGIPQEHSDKIMQPFFTTKEPGKNAGLGLSTSLSLARKYGGDLYLDSNQSNTCFVFEIPLKGDGDVLNATTKKAAS